VLTDCEVVSESEGFGGQAREILRRCHDSDGVIWLCERQDDGALVWFIPSGRKYPTDERLPVISSTAMREHLNHTPRAEVYEAIREVALNAKVLLRILDSAKINRMDANPRSRRCSSVGSAVAAGNPDSECILDRIEVETKKSWELSRAKKTILELARKAVYCGPVEFRAEVKDDMVRGLANEVDQARRKRSSSI